MATIGRKPGSVDSGYGEMNADTARVTYMGSFSTATWVTRVGARMGRNTGTNASAKVIFYDMAGPSSSPSTLFYASSAKTISAYMADIASGSNYEWSVSGLPIAAGRKLGGGIWADVASIAYGQDNSGAMMYFDSASSVPNPYNEDSSSPQGKISVWMTGVSNRKPNTPGIVAPASGSTTIDPTPDITVSFSDPDEAYGDTFGKYRIELWNDANDTLLYTSGVVTTNGTQKSTKKATYTVPSTLAAGTYTVRAYTYDYFGVVSTARVWRFIVNTGGAFDPPELRSWHNAGTRSDGVDVTTTTTPGVQAVWHHDAAQDVDGVDVRVVNADTGSVVRAAEFVGTGGLADGATYESNLTTIWGTAWTDLPRGGTVYAFEMRGQDALGSWSDWARGESFVVNAIPAPGFNVSSPADGAYTSTRPRIHLTVIDSTDDPGSHDVTLYIADDGVTFTSYAMGYSGASAYGGVYGLYTSSTHLPAYDTYTYYVEATDPWGETGTSETRTLNYVAAPSITITAPSGTITTGTPTVTATVDRTVSQYRVTITNSTTDATAYDSGIITNPTISHAIPAATLYNETDYTLSLWVKTSDTLETTETGTFTVEYVAPAAMTNVALETVASSDFDLGDATLGQEPNVELTWDVVDDVTVPDAEWIGYLITRTSADGEQVQWTVADRNQPGMTDTTPSGGVEYTYIVQYQQVENDVDILNSTPVELTATVDIKHATITSENPDDPAVTLHFWDDRGASLNVGVETVELLGQATPETWHSNLAYDRITGTFTPISDPSGNGYYTARQVVEAVRTLAKPITDEDGRVVPRTLTYRDAKGRNKRVVLIAVEEVDHHLYDRAAFTLEMVEVAS